MLLDQDAFESFRRGDPAIMEKIYKAYVHTLYLYTFKKLRDTQQAEDVTAETLVKLWQSRDKMINPEHIHRFVFMVAKNKCIDLQRRHRRVTSLDPLADEIGLLEEDDGAFFRRLEAQVTAELLQLLEKEVEKLPRVRREVFRLSCIEYKSVSEVAVHLGIREKTVYTHRAQAINQLRKAFKFIMYPPHQ